MRFRHLLLQLKVHHFQRLAFQFQQTDHLTHRQFLTLTLALELVLSNLYLVYPVLLTLQVQTLHHLAQFLIQLLAQEDHQAQMRFRHFLLHLLLLLKAHHFQRLALQFQQTDHLTHRQFLIQLLTQEDHQAQAKHLLFLYQIQIMKYHHLRLHQLQLTSLHHEVCLLKVPLILLHLLLQYHRHAFPERFLLLQNHHQAIHLEVLCCLHPVQEYHLRLYLIKIRLKAQCYLHQFQYRHHLQSALHHLQSALHHRQVVHQVMPYYHHQYLNLSRHHHHPVGHLIERYYHL